MSRLPTPGSDNGTWGDVLNDYLLVAHNNDGTLKPDAVDAAALQDGSIAETKLNVSGGTDGQVLTKNSSASGGFEWGSVPAPAVPSNGYPLSAMGAFAASCHPDTITTVSNINNACFVLVFVPANHTITSAGVYIKNAGTVGAGGLNGFSVYSESGSLIASTPSDDTLWSTTGWRSKSFTTPIAAQSTDRFVYVGMSVNGYSAAPDTWYRQSSVEFSEGTAGFTVRRRSFLQTGLSSWPASFTPASYGSSFGGFIPFVALA